MGFNFHKNCWEIFMWLSRSHLNWLSTSELQSCSNEQSRLDIQTIHIPTIFNAFLPKFGLFSLFYNLNNCKMQKTQKTHVFFYSISSQTCFFFTWISKTNPFVVWTRTCIINKASLIYWVRVGVWKATIKKYQLP